MVHPHRRSKVKVNVKSSSGGIVRVLNICRGHRVKPGYSVKIQPFTGGSHTNWDKRFHNLSRSFPDCSSSGRAGGKFTDAGETNLPSSASFTVPSLDLSKPSQSGLSGFTCNMSP